MTTLACVDEAALEHLRHEFLCLPGLRLTPQQAQRLLSVDKETCMSVLTTLVETGILVQAADGAFIRVSIRNR